eukprot:TRINITY_DN3993_c0_g1_i1.p3 TRINITY_DN3993_c0_g1~~TRINITY_DN3993_c0_g1_i1.p3  ORF type:complete len:233 (+),score=35.98 TRINITY_DN3993_c0_g1_i1:840-1538(+)
MPHATTIVGDNFGLDYVRYRAAEREKEMEEVRRQMATQLLEKQVQESARKEFTLVFFVKSNRTPKKMEEGPRVEDLILESEKKKKERKDELMAQIQEKERNRSAAKQREKETEKVAAERIRALQQKQLEELLALRQREIDEKRAEMNKSFEMSERKKVLFIHGNKNRERTDSKKRKKGKLSWNPRRDIKISFRCTQLKGSHREKNQLKNSRSKLKESCTNKKSAKRLKRKSR